MKLLKQINTAVPLLEDAAGGAVSAGGVAGAGLPLFSSLVKRTKQSAPKAEENDELIPANEPTAAKKSLKLGEAFRRLSEQLDGEENDVATRQAAIDTEDTIARLKSLETRETADKRDCVVFGLEDGDGGVVRVSIKPDQAEEFEQALQNYVNDRESKDDAPEIAEILFNMRDHFDIIDVQWPEVQEDEEQVTDIEGGDELPPEGDLPPEDMAMPAGPDESQVTDLLSQVIDMMKADAAARHADAKAREAEAKTREASAIVAQSMSRVKQEEQFLDMEQAQKAAKEEQKETKRLAQLAKWKRDVEAETGVSDFDDADLDPMQGDAPQVDVSREVSVQGGREEEERAGHPFAEPKSNYMKTFKDRSTAAPKKDNYAQTFANKGKARAKPYDIASFILKRVKT